MGETLRFACPESKLQIQCLFRYDQIGNCGLTLIQDVCPYRLTYEMPPQPITPEERDGLYKALAEGLNNRCLTNYVFSDNVLKGGVAYGSTNTRMDSLSISTGGFAEFLIRKNYGRITCSHRMSNTNHCSAHTWSIIQMWIWTPPGMRATIERPMINAGIIKRAWLRGRERIFKMPEELKEVQSVSTKW